jgi:hypothetical protein
MKIYIPIPYKMSILAPMMTIGFGRTKKSILNMLLKKKNQNETSFLSVILMLVPPPPRHRLHQSTHLPFLFHSISMISLFSDIFFLFLEQFLTFSVHCSNIGSTTAFQTSDLFFLIPTSLLLLANYYIPHTVRSLLSKCRSLIPTLKLSSQERPLRLKKGSVCSN